MPPLQAFYLISSAVIFALAWTRGGHVERRVVGIMLLAYVASLLLLPWATDRYRPGDILVDTLFLIALGHLALTRDRWWLIIAVAAQVLTMVSHAHLLLNPEVSLRDNVAVRWAFGVVMLYSLLGGVAERWLAGERAAMPRLRTRSPTRRSGPARDGLNI